MDRNLEEIIKRENPEFFKKMEADKRKYGSHLKEENRKTINKMIEESERQKERELRELEEMIREESKPIIKGRKIFIINNSNDN